MTYYPDKEKASLLKTNLNFLKFFYEITQNSFFLEQTGKMLKLQIFLCVYVFYSSFMKKMLFFILIAVTQIGSIIK